MLQSIRSFLNRPIAEEFRFKNHFKLAWQAGLYVFVFVSLLNGSFSHLTHVAITALVSVGIVGVVLFDPKLPTTAYFQYVILVRNSDMTEPLEP